MSCVCYPAGCVRGKRRWESLSLFWFLSKRRHCSNYWYIIPYFEEGSNFAFFLGNRAWLVQLFFNLRLISDYSTIPFLPMVGTMWQKFQFVHHWTITYRVPGTDIFCTNEVPLWIGIYCYFFHDQAIQKELYSTMLQITTVYWWLHTAKGGIHQSANCKSQIQLSTSSPSCICPALSQNWCTMNCTYLLTYLHTYILTYRWLRPSRSWTCVNRSVGIKLPPNCEHILTVHMRRSKRCVLK